MQRMTPVSIFLLSFLLVLLSVLPSPAQQTGYEIPDVYNNIEFDEDGRMVFIDEDGTVYKHYEPEPEYRLSDFLDAATGTEEGLAFDFNNEQLNGIIYFGLIPYGDSRHPQVVYRPPAKPIVNGKTEVSILERLSGKYDMTGWQKSGKMTIGYRIINEDGLIIHDGKINVRGTGPFEVDASIIDGPFVNMLTHESVVISCITNDEMEVTVQADGREFKTGAVTKYHEISIDGLSPDTKYDYTIHFGENSETYSFHTAPEPGSRKPFMFAYASDSRSSPGGGERNILGANGYMMKKILAAATYFGADFMQFTGDMIDGYSWSVDRTLLEYRNWKSAVRPFTHYFPLVATMGNHEALNHIFVSETGGDVSVDKFPFDEVSAEVIFAREFVNPLNGPESEDGAVYDPNPGKTDFPSYKENVFHYRYDNVAMIVLNSNYWFAPTLKYKKGASGNLHAYLMDNQMLWLEETLAEMEDDETIDHIFVTQHTPAFPNGGHVKDDMWYYGNNEKRPFVNGEPVEHGIIERRDEYLDLLVNKSSKVRAILTGDEHNYARTKITNDVNIYPEDWEFEKLHFSRPFHQINNGAAGAPYYAQEPTPWSEAVSGFTTQNAVVLFYVDGDDVAMKVYNPDTLELIDEMKLH